ncbi:MAG: hypothetical protein GY861_27265 [bacterium]|nr:hypothetical protein [bacterium]
MIKTQEYKFITKLGGLYRALPEIPHADSDRHIIVMELLGNQPNISTVLTDPRVTISPKTNDANRLLFIFVEMKPHILKVASPQEKYRLGDGHQIGGTFDLTYQVADAEEFWRGAKDPIAVLEAAVVNEAKNYFLSITSHYLVSSPADLKKTLEQHIQDTEIKIVKSNLEDSIREKCLISGIEIIKVHANVQLSEELSEHLKRIHDRIYGQDGTLDKRYSQKMVSDHRRSIDEMIDRDTTFLPHKLRNVTMMLDTGLLENFYTMEWSDAMRKVHDELSKQKNAYLAEQKTAKINDYRDRLKIAQEAQLDEVHILDLKDKLAKELTEDKEDSSQLFSNNHFLQLAIGSISSAGQLTSSTPKQIPSPTENSKTDKG